MTSHAWHCHPSSCHPAKVRSSWDNLLICWVIFVLQYFIGKKTAHPWNRLNLPSIKLVLLRTPCWRTTDVSLAAERLLSDSCLQKHAQCSGPTGTSTVFCYSCWLRFNFTSAHFQLETLLWPIPLLQNVSVSIISYIGMGWSKTAKGKENKTSRKRVKWLKTVVPEGLRLAHRYIRVGLRALLPPINPQCQRVNLQTWWIKSSAFGTFSTAPGPRITSLLALGIRHKNVEPK